LPATLTEDELRLLFAIKSDVAIGKEESHTPEAAYLFQQLYGFDEWRRALAGQFDESKFSVGEDVDDPDSVDVAMVWTLPDGGLERFVNLRAILSLGAGINQLDLQRLPKHVPLARLVDTSLTHTTVDYAKTAVYRYHRRFHIFERKSRERNWTYIPPTVVFLS
jgi:glyoxylate/hydroxypyruvate reductase